MSFGIGREAAARPYCSRVSCETLRHSISAATSRSTAVSSFIRTDSAACAIAGPFAARMRGVEPPMTRGQKKFSWASAAAWKVRALTPPAPSARSRVRSSPAARVVKVSAIMRSGSKAPVATP